MPQTVTKNRYDGPSTFHLSASADTQTRPALIILIVFLLFLSLSFVSYYNYCSFSTGVGLTLECYQTEVGMEPFLWRKYYTKYLVFSTFSFFVMASALWVKIISMIRIRPNRIHLQVYVGCSVCWHKVPMLQIATNKQIRRTFDQLQSTVCTDNSDIFSMPFAFVFCLLL